MSRTTLTQAALQAMFAQETGDALLPLLTIDHPDLPAPIHLVADQQDLVHGGTTYQALGFEVTLPADTEERVPEVRVAVDNVDRQVVQSLRGLSSPPTVTLEVVRVDSAGAVSAEIPPMSFRLNQAQYDALRVEGAVGYEADYLNEPATRHRFDSTIAPGLF